LYTHLEKGDEMTNKEYLTFVNRPEDLPEGKEIELLIKDLTQGRQKYDARYVKAIVSRSPLPGADTLQVRGLVGLPFPGTWSIKITGELGEFPYGFRK
jgi:hypothetical protein